MGADGRARLKAGGVADAEQVHGFIRTELMAQLPPPSGKRGKAVEAMAQSREWEEAFTFALHASDMLIGQLEAGNGDPFDD
jgi:hypothetical protein